jgi:hypothetical protein
MRTTTATRDDAPTPAPETGAATPSRLRRVANELAGPLLILALTVFALRQFVFQPLLTNQHPDILAFITPRLAFLGRSLSAGHVPLWNPFDMTGTPYVADPQSGWLYATPMALFSLLSPGAAMRAFIAFNPALAGLGCYAFLRLERISRPAATVGGLSLALAMAASVIAISIPFAGAIAWTTVALVGAAGYLRAGSLSRRILWLGLAALAWGQVASAHMSHGLAMCTILLAALLIAHAVLDARGEDRGGYRPALLVAAFLAVLPLANLAIFVPRLAYVARSSLQGGYAVLGEPLARAAGVGARPLMTNGVWSGWPFSLGSAPGAYVGALVLLAVPLALRTRRHRAVVVSFAGVAALGYVLTLNALVTAEWFRSLVLQIPYGDVYLHNPGRLRYLAYLTVPVLAAVGVQALIDRPLPRKRLARWLAAGAVLWLALPVALGASPTRFILLAIGIVAAVLVLLALGDRRRWAAVAVPLVLAGELAAAAAFAQLYQGGTVRLGLESGDHANLLPGPLRAPDVAERAFLRTGPIARFLADHPGDRYFTYAPPASNYVKGYLWTQGERDWPALENERGTLFGIRDVFGYNPVQLPRYWSWIRAVNPLPIFYNASVLPRPTLQQLRLLGARYLIIPKGVPLPGDVTGSIVATEDGYDLYEVFGSQPRASVVSEWSVADDAAEALRTVLEPRFDPGAEAVLERGPGITPTPSGGVAASPGAASYREAAPEDVRVSVRAPAPSILVVRTNWDEGWTATVDGAPAPVLRADYFRQGVPVPAGRHEVRLVYRDARIGSGLLASAITWSVLIASLLAAVVVERSRRAPGSGRLPAGGDGHGGVGVGGRRREA